jgi:outer membrane translocation and assembly module TamA
MRSTTARALDRGGGHPWIVLVLGLLCWMGGVEATVYGQSRRAQARGTVDTTGPVVRRVRIVGNDAVSDDVLKRQIRTSPNRRILGIPGLTWWRWVYQLGSADWMWDRVGGALRSGGEPPAYLDSTTVAGDVERLQLYYRQQGYRTATVDYEVETDEQKTRATVTFRVRPGTATYLRRVTYEGLEGLTAEQKRRLAEGTVLDAASTDAETPLSFEVERQRYQEPLLLEERRRLLSFLRDEGYASVSRDSIRAIAYRLSPDSMDITFRVRPGPQYRYGDVHVSITGPEGSATRRDTIDVPGGGWGAVRPQVTARIEQEDRLDLGILRRSLQFRPGEIYKQSDVRATKQRLEGTGVFTFTSIQPQFEGAVRPDSMSRPYLPIRVEGRTRDRHRLRAETFALQRETVAGAESDLSLNEFGVGVSGVYENVNALGGGETFRIRLSGSAATALDSTLVSSTQFEATTSLTLPYLVAPFGRFENVFDLSNARTRISLTGLTARNNTLGLRIRGRGNAQLRLEMDHTPTRTSLVDVIDLSVSNPDTLRGFSSRVFGPEGEAVQDPVQRQQILDDYTRPQINTTLRYTFRAATADPLRRSAGHIYEFSGEVGNTLPALLDRYVFDPATTRYSLPGISGRRLLYRPYVRGTADLRRYLPLGRGATLAVKLFGGMAHPIAGPNVVPFDRRFFSGGANSVRGWRLRDLGPGTAGRVPLDTTGTASTELAALLGGDMKLEASVELRNTLLRNFLTARWVGATFLDVGNVWFGPRNPGFGGAGEERAASPSALKQVRAAKDGQSGRFEGVSSLANVGVGGGLGIRVEWEYITVRFDLAYRLHDPSVRDDDLFSDTFSGPLLHFGIGQAF